MTKRRWIAVLPWFLGLSGLFSGVVFSEKPNVSNEKAIFQKGNQQSNNGKIQEAIAEFQKLHVDKKRESFAVLFNLGNAYFRLQQFGMALAYYRKAEKYRPNDEKLLHNLHLVFQKVGKVEDTKASSKAKVLFWYYLFNTKTLFWMFQLSLFFGFFFLSFWLYQKEKEMGGLLRILFVISFLFAFVLGASFFVKVATQEFQRNAVVIDSKKTARSGYGKSFEALFILHEGDEVRVLEKVQGWVKVEWEQVSKKSNLSTQTGWIPETSLKEI